MWAATLAAGRWSLEWMYHRGGVNGFDFSDAPKRQDTR